MKHLILLLILSLIPASILFSQSTQKKEVEGFTQILTEKKLGDWDGNPDYWRFEDGVLIGEVPGASPLQGNIFYRWEKKVKDFELKVEYRISSKGNSGIYYRSTTSTDNRNVLLGYQADIDGANTYSGIVYENYANRGHKILVNRGNFIQVSEDDVPVRVGSISKKAKLASKIHNDGWNEYYVIARGNTIVQFINGQVMSILIDDYKDRITEGMLGVQLHHGPPMKVEFRNFRFKKLPNSK